jgi:hypothetical protein
MWYTYTMEFYSAMKKKEIMLFAGIGEHHVKRCEPGSKSPRSQAFPSNVEARPASDMQI